MIISRTPYRISFFGGGTDYPGWYREHGGTVLATTINKYCWLTCRYLPPFFEHRFRIIYSRAETCETIEEIAHPAVREGLRLMGVTRGIELHHDGDLPARSGMGSSSAFTVGLLHVLHALKGEMVSKQQLAQEGIALEQEHLEENVGSQDQVMAAYGGFNHVVFTANGDILVRPVTVRPARLWELQGHLMLLYTGIARTASEVAATFVRSLEDRRRQLRILKDLVDESLALLASDRDISAFGDLLHESWLAKRDLGSAVSGPAVDAMYEEARAAGARGGKLLGAGGGGFLLLFVPPDLQARVRQRLGGLLHVPFKFEFTGSQIIFLDREEDYSAHENNRPARPAAVEWSARAEAAPPAPPAPAEVGRA
jgi:D-glycero-alpha-D-manno-heptose-7-phosphate kinase